MLGAFRASRVLLDGRNLFTKKVRMTQTRKRNARKRLRQMMDNAEVIREGRSALTAVNARIAEVAGVASRMSKPKGMP
jgi:Mitochondrial ribosomal protein L31